MLTSLAATTLLVFVVNLGITYYQAWLSRERYAEAIARITELERARDAAYKREYLSDDVDQIQVDPKRPYMKDGVLG
jgi:hypothetical protein